MKDDQYSHYKCQAIRERYGRCKCEKCIKLLKSKKWNKHKYYIVKIGSRISQSIVYGSLITTIVYTITR